MADPGGSSLMAHTLISWHVYAAYRGDWGRQIRLDGLLQSINVFIHADILRLQV